MLEEEALAIEWMTNATGKIQVVGKNLLRSALGRSPDRLDSLVIGLANGIGRIGHTFYQGWYLQ